MFKKKLILKKTHDFSAVKKPKLTVVFVHGIASDSTTWNHALDYLEGTMSLKEVRFVAFDLLGSGRSSNDQKLEFGYKDQIEALGNSLKRLKLKSPLVLVGHSLGALVVTKYASDYKKAVRELILVSPPTYTEKDLGSAVFKAEMEAFKKIVAAKDRKYVNDKAFNNKVAKIILNKYNYKRLCELTTPAVLIYSESDKIIAPQNIRKAVRANAKYLRGVTTIGTHRVARDKYNKIREVLEEVLNA